jgi:hypothetical protein
MNAIGACWRRRERAFRAACEKGWEGSRQTCLVSKRPRALE